jgi:hypothetical protein
MEQRRKRLRLLGLIGLAGLLIFFLARRATSPPTDPAVPVDPPPAGPTTRTTFPTPVPQVVKPPPTPMSSEGAGAPIVDGIDFEKSEVCEGEESLVTIRAHTPGNKDDGYLHYFVAGQSTRTATVIGSRSTGTNEHRTVSVFGRDNAVTHVELPVLRVKDCKATHRLMIANRPVANTTGVIELVAQVVTLQGDKLVPVRFEWDFGDGKKSETTSAAVEHDYGGRAQDALYSYPIVSCTARDAKGQSVIGKIGLALHNASFENKQVKGVVSLLFDFTPRFPQLGSDGVVSQKVRVWHHGDGAVMVEKVTLSRRFEGGGDPPAQDVSPGSLFPRREIPPIGVELALSLDTHEGNLVALDYQIEGRAPGGEPVLGRFSIMKPPPVPTREQHVPVVDPELRAKIMRARELLGKKLVTDDDIWRLEQEGKMKDLKFDPGAVGAIPEPARR